MRKATMPHPKDMPLDQWPPGWLKMAVASLLDMPEYIMMHDHDREDRELPVTHDEMRAFIQSHRGK